MTIDPTQLTDEQLTELVTSDKVLDGITRDIRAMASPAESKADSQCGLPSDFYDMDCDGMA